MKFKNIIIIIFMMFSLSISVNAYLDYDTFNRTDGAAGVSEGQSTTYISYAGNHMSIVSKSLHLFTDSTTSGGELLSWANNGVSTTQFNITVGDKDTTLRLYRGENGGHDGVCGIGINGATNQASYIELGVAISMGMTVDNSKSYIFTIIHNITSSPDSCTYIVSNDTHTVSINNTDGEADVNQANVFRYIYHSGFGLGSDYYMEEFYICEGHNLTCLPSLNIVPSFIPFTIETLFSNETHITEYKTLYQESENFFTYINWTNSTTGAGITGTEGECNITQFEGMEEQYSLYNNYTLCTTSCDYSELSDSFNFDHNGTVEVNEDLIILKVCHENIATENLNINAYCNSVEHNFIIDNLEFTTCDLGFTTIELNFSDCINYTNINLTILNNAIYNKRHLIYEWELDREYKLRNLHSTHGEIFYNSTLGLWRTNSSTEYYNNGLKSINSSCALNGVPDSEVSSEDILTIVNAIPQIFITQLVFDDDIIQSFNQTGLTFFEYINQSPEWIYSISDHDLQNFTVNFRDGTGTLLFNVTLYEITNIEVSPYYFVNFTDGNTYNISITAYDTVNVSYKEYLFNVTDTSIPTFTGFNDDVIEINKDYTWNAYLRDEYLWSFYITCDNGYAFSETGIAKELYHFTESILINETVICTGNVSDGHTDTVMRDIPIYKDFERNTLTFDNLDIKTKENLKSITTIKKIDRVNFCFETLNHSDTLEVEIPDDCIIAPNSKYLGHYVCSSKNLAIDFESEEGYTTLRKNNSHILLDVSKAKTQDLCFNSIVELNTVYFNLTILAVPPLPISMTDFDLSELKNIVLLFVIAFLYLGVMAIGMMFKDVMFMSFGFFLGIVLGFMFANLNIYLTFVFFFINIGIYISVAKRK